jgi:hypothetical protein
MMPDHHRADGTMENSDDWQVTLAGLAVAGAAIDQEHQPAEILEGMARALALVAKSLAEDDEEHQTAILGHVQGALQEGFDGITVETAKAVTEAFSQTGAKAVGDARALLGRTKSMLAEIPSGQPAH